MKGRPALRGKAAMIGGGVIGGGWAARFLLHGWDVDVFDIGAGIESQIEAILDNARASAPALADAPMPAEGRLNFAESLADAITEADWIQESVPEDLTVKHRVLADIQAAASSDAIIASSTSGFKPSELQQDAADPGQILVAHPFNPVYLLPLVEVVPSSAVASEVTQRACEMLTSIGMKPLVVRNEIDAHIADRLMEAVWREALWLINDDVATTEEIDNAIRNGFGLRWAQMGLFETFRLAGGEAGMAHFIRQFGPALQWPWTKLTNVPKLTEELVKKVSDQSDAQSGQFSIRELEKIRDRNLVGMLRSLKERDWGAGAVLNAHDAALMASADTEAIQDASVPMRLLDLSVLPAWIDYNGHMTEFRYVQVFSDSCEALLKTVGMHADYVAAGHSFYTAETHTQFFDEVGVNAAIYTTAQILTADAKRLRVFYRLHAAADDRLLATLEAMYLHVNTDTGRVCEAEPNASKQLMKIARMHAKSSPPDAAGRYVGQR